jgi:thiol-disulfide isomerase/thioredoxin
MRKRRYALKCSNDFTTRRTSVGEPNMRKILMTSWVLASAVWAASSFAGPADETPAVTMKLLPEGAMRKIGGYMPQRVTLAVDEPAGLKKKPVMEAPLYGQVKFGGKTFLIALDEPEDQDAKLYVDSNGNGDLTDDTPAEWKKQTRDGPNGTHLTQYMGSFKLPLQTGDKSTLVSMGSYRFDKKDPQRAALKSNLFYYCDYAYEGEIKIGDSAYHTLLVNDLADGDFRGMPAAEQKTTVASAGAGVRLMIDLNGDGKYDFRSETFDPRKPFNIKGATWQVADMTSGGSFKIQKSAKEVDEIPLPPDLSKGHAILAFDDKLMDGKKVNFPGDYKGKLVLLDFWATWCGPCMAEVPNIVKTYNEYHPKGFEILGISLDQPKAEDKITKVTGEKGMTWPQVYDGKFWDARIAQMYAIHSIPQAYLVDGDTGKVIAEGEALRGEDLEKVLKAAIEAKAKGAGKTASE